jgi:hypothetical protein
MSKRESEKRVVLFAAIDRAQHEALRYIAFRERRSIADVAREALDEYIAQKSKEYPISVVEPQLIETVKVLAGRP